MGATPNTAATISASAVPTIAAGASDRSQYERRSDRDQEH
jgi:hypothetical protein